MKLMSLKQYMKMSKPALIRKITKTLRAMPKKRLAIVCYNITKAKLPQLTVHEKSLSPKQFSRKYFSKSAKRIRAGQKKKFSRKQLAAQRLFAKRARAGTLRKRRRR